MSRPQDRPAQSHAYGMPPEQRSPDQQNVLPAVLAHISGPLALLLSAGWLSFVGPLLVWLVYKNSNQLGRQAAAGAFNFNIGLWVMIIVGWILVFTVVGIPVSIVLWVIAGVAMLVCHIIGLAKAARGKPYRYPFQIRILD